MALSLLFTANVETESPRPFLKWAGGKTKLLDAILPRLPPHAEHYVEPFLGGGSVFFALQKAGRLRKASLSDANPGLIELYRLVRDDLDTLLEELEALPNPLGKEAFYSLRSQEPERLSAPKRCARLLALNKTCFNGLFRVNRQGAFNVPYGRFARPPTVFRASHLRACSRALQGVRLRCVDFAEALEDVGPEGVVYLDPPYVPTSRTASFVGYRPGGFTAADNRRLRDAIDAIHGVGARWLLSNSHSPEALTAYDGYAIALVRSHRSISSNVNRRGPIGELLIHGGEAA